jgi:hypothetical protein
VLTQECPSVSALREEVSVFSGKTAQKNDVVDTSPNPTMPPYSTVATPLKSRNVLATLSLNTFRNPYIPTTKITRNHH